MTGSAFRLCPMRVAAFTVTGIAQDSHPHSPRPCGRRVVVARPGRTIHETPMIADDACDKRTGCCHTGAVRATKGRGCCHVSRAAKGRAQGGATKGRGQDGSGADAAFKRSVCRRAGWRAAGESRRAARRARGGGRARGAWGRRGERAAQGKVTRGAKPRAGRRRERQSVGKENVSRETFVSYQQKRVCCARGNASGVAARDRACSGRQAVGGGQPRGAVDCGQREAARGGRAVGSRAVRLPAGGGATGRSAAWRAGQRTAEGRTMGRAAGGGQREAARRGGLRTAGGRATRQTAGNGRPRGAAASARSRERGAGVRSLPVDNR